MHTEYVVESLGHHLNDIAQILFFLMGAMTIVELVDAAPLDRMQGNLFPVCCIGQSYYHDCYDFSDT